MKNITCVHTGMGLAPVLETVFSNAVGEISCNHIVDTGILRDVIRDGGVSDLTEKRLLSLFEEALMAKPDLVVCTCSSIGDVADKAAAMHPEAKIIRIDHAMAEYAVEHFEKIAVMATLTTTITPSCRLVERLAEKKGKHVQVISATAEGAFANLIGNKPDEALQCMKDCAVKLCKDAQVLLLAQASMGNFAEELSKVTGVPVFTSPALCAEELKTIL